ncbi:unnamed protein product [Rotaria magnacalcarata]|uniref:Transposase n=1 Tax=Rotaria magnacalcarata TaxID=392030 RepID=A0A816V9P7_9BILA|nr:unnamed protein product [Rotaria magnacalcarata]
MPRKQIDPQHEGRVLALLQLKYSQRQIIKTLKNDGISVSQRTVSNIKRKIGVQRNSTEKIKFSRQRPAFTPLTISKVIQKIDVEDPPTQRSIARSCHISQSTVSRIIKSTNFVLRKKYKVQKLTSSNIKKRCQRARRFYRKLANHRYENFVTTDESWFYLNGTEEKRKVCYIKKNNPDYERMIIQQDSSRPKGFMVWAGISSRGKTSIRFVAPGTKINSNYYIKHILKPFLSRDLPRLFPDGQEKQMIYHHDSAPSHVSKETIAFMNKTKINYVKPQEWMPKSPDAAPMDYVVWGHLKQRLNKCKIETLDQLKKKLYMSGRRLIKLILIKF